MNKKYNRNISIKEVGTEGQKKLLEAKVLIAGAGGLGSTVIASLAGAGIGVIGIVDKDIIEETNLNRQYIHKIENLGKQKVDSAKEWIKNYNPEINVRTYNCELNDKNYKEIIEPYDLIIDCFDSFESKFLLNKISFLCKKPLIHGGITEFYGQVTTIIPNETPCLNCLFPEPETQTYIAKGVMSPFVSTIASIQSAEAIKLILKIGEPLKNHLLTFNGLNMEFKKLKISKNSNCPLCGN